MKEFWVGLKFWRGEDQTIQKIHTFVGRKPFLKTVFLGVKTPKIVLFLHRCKIIAPPFLSGSSSEEVTSIWKKVRTFFCWKFYKHIFQKKWDENVFKKIYFFEIFDFPTFFAKFSNIYFLISYENCSSRFFENVWKNSKTIFTWVGKQQKIWKAASLVFLLRSAGGHIFIVTVLSSINLQKSFFFMFLQ